MRTHAGALARAGGHASWEERLDAGARAAGAAPNGKRAGCANSYHRREARIDQWLAAAAITRGYVLRSVDRHGRIGESISGQAILDLVAECARIKPHDLRRTCPKLCRKAGGELAASRTSSTPQRPAAPHIFVICDSCYCDRI